MRKPVKKPAKGRKPEGEEAFAGGRAWERVEQFRNARGLESIQPTPSSSTRKPSSKTKPAARKPKPK